MGLWGRSSGIQNFNQNDRTYYESKILAFCPCECSTTTQFLVPFEDIFSHESSRRRREAAKRRAAKPQNDYSVRNENIVHNHFIAILKVRNPLLGTFYMCIFFVCSHSSFTANSTHAVQYCYTLYLLL